MTDGDFINGLFHVSKDKGRMAHLRRVMNNDPSRVQGLGIIASLGVPTLSTKEALPYKAVAFMFGAAKSTTSHDKIGNFGCSLRAVVRRDQSPDNGRYPFDRRFDRMVSCSSVEHLIKDHLMRLQKFTSDVSLDYYHLLQDLKSWNKNTANNWISGYYSN
jgi:CRISPR type I-E-associated protein CasB/Cse2